MPKRLILLVWAVFAAQLSWVGAQAPILREVYDPKTDTKIEVKSLFGTMPGHGYVPVRAAIKNGGKVARTWTFDFRARGQMYFNETGGVSSSFSVTLEPGAAGSYDFCVPVPSDFSSGGYGYGSQLEVTVGASGLGPVSGSFSSNAPTDKARVLISEALHTPNGSALDAEVSKLSHGGNSFGGVFQAGALPSDWRAFLGYDRMLITDNEWLSIAPGARSAILQWNRLGGQLVIYSSATNSDLAAMRFGEEGAGATELSRSLGRVVLRKISSDLKLDAARTVAELASVPAQIEAIRSDYASGWPLQAKFGAQGFDYAVFVVVLILFGILVGPVNLFVFAKSGQRHRMFFTTPLISLGASLVLVVLIILKDGFGGSGIRFVHMELRPEAGENVGYLRQEQFARTGVLLSSRHVLPEAGFVTGVPLAESPWARVTTNYTSRSGNYTLQKEGQGLAASGDWYQSRSEHGHLLYALRPTRGRIEMDSNNPPRLVSSFDFPIELLVFKDKDGKCWTARNLTQGASVTADPIGESSYQDAVRQSTSLASETLGKSIKPLAQRHSHFLARTGAAPGLESYPGIHWRETTTVITGPLTTR